MARRASGARDGGDVTITQIRTAVREFALQRHEGRQRGGGRGQDGKGRRPARRAVSGGEEELVLLLLLVVVLVAVAVLLLLLRVSAVVVVAAMPRAV